MRKLNGRKAVADILLVIEKHCELSLSLLDIFYRLLLLSKSFFLKIISELQSESQTVLIQIRPDILSGLKRVQTVRKGYQQTTPVDKKLIQ